MPCGFDSRLDHHFVCISFFGFLKKHGDIAQSGERIVRIDEVTGSIPAVSTIFFQNIPVAQRIERLPPEQEVAGSIPVRDARWGCGAEEAQFGGIEQATGSNPVISTISDP